MHTGSLYHGDIIAAFKHAVPGCYIRDYRDKGGCITICRDYRDIKWGDQLSTQRVYRTIPAITLVSLARGFMTPQTIFNGLRLCRPGWKEEFHKAARYLSDSQMRRITRALGARELFEGVAI